MAFAAHDKIAEVARWVERHHILYLHWRLDEDRKRQYIERLVEVVRAVDKGENINDGHWDL